MFTISVLNLSHTGPLARWTPALFAETGVSWACVPAWTTADCSLGEFQKPKREKKSYRRWKRSPKELLTSSSTQALQIKPKTGVSPSLNMKVIGQLPWPGGNFYQVSNPQLKTESPPTHPAGLGLLCFLAKETNACCCVGFLCSVLCLVMF